MAWFRPSVPCIRAEQWRARWSSNAWVGSGSERFAVEEFDGGRWVFAATTQLSWPRTTANARHRHALSQGPAHLRICPLPWIALDMAHRAIAARRESRMGGCDCV